MNEFDGLGMVIPTQELTSLSPCWATPSELQEARTDASLICTSAADSLNAMTSVGLSSVGFGEGKHDQGHRGVIVSRVPVVSANGTPLMPCKPAKARKLLRDGKAIKKWSKLGIFYLRLNFNPANPTTQPLVVGVDPGSKFEGFSVVGTQDTVLNSMSEAVTWVKKAVQVRREMRRARRHRNTRCRPCGFNNRQQNRTPPSTKARWDVKLRIVQQLKKIIPISVAVVEDVKARAKKGQRRWNKNFSPIEAGKQYFYTELRRIGLGVKTKRGSETQQLRGTYGLRKLCSKSKPVFETHCVDAWVLAASEAGAKQPTTRSLHYLAPIRFHRRQLHKLQPSVGGKRRREGGTISLGIKRGTLVKHAKYGLCYVGGNMKGKLSLHALTTGERLTQTAKKTDLKLLTRIAFRHQFLPPLKNVGFLGNFRR